MKTTLAILYVLGSFVAAQAHEEVVVVEQPAAAVVYNSPVVYTAPVTYTQPVVYNASVSYAPVVQAPVACTSVVYTPEVAYSSVAVCSSISPNVVVVGGGYSRAYYTSIDTSPTVIRFGGDSSCGQRVSSPNFCNTYSRPLIVHPPVRTSCGHRVLYNTRVACNK